MLGTMRIDTTRLAASTVGLLALMTSAAAPLAAQAPADPPSAAEARYYVGPTAFLGLIPSPFDFHQRCDPEVVERADVSGLEGHIALVVGSLDFTARVAAGREMGPTIVCPDVLRLRADGVHLVDHHFGEVDGDWIQTLEVQVGWSPARARFLRGGLGGGWVRGTDAPYGAATLGVRFGDRVRVLADLGLVYSSAPFVRVREEWLDWELVRQTHVGEGRSWAPGGVLRAGIEARLP